MPYAIPVSPIPSPSKDAPSKKSWLSPPTHIEDTEAGPSVVSAPLPSIPRRASSSTSNGHVTPKRSHSPATRRTSDQGPSDPFKAFPASRPMEGLPRRGSSQTGSTGNAFGISGLPITNNEGTLGLKLFPSPTKNLGAQRAINDSISSVSTVESSLPSTPADETQDLPVTLGAKNDDTKKDGNQTPDIPFPSFEPPVFRQAPIPHRAFSQNPPLRPSIGQSRRSSGLGHHRGSGPSGGSLQIPIPTSASTSELPQQPQAIASPNASLRPISSMIRKKSGEVVKPSLKIRSMSTPDLSRQNTGAASSPDQEGRDFPDERSKSVRFAGGDDGDAQALEHVVLFLREQKPLAVGRAADPDHVGLVTDTETEVDADDTDASDFVQFRTRRNAAARAADEAGQILLEGGSRVPRIRTDFSPDARGSLDGENVVLERVEVVNGPGPLCLRGTVIVRNVAFQKWVTVRFTLDHWQTLSEVGGTHVTHIPSSTTGDEGWDRFTFTIKLEDFKRKIDERQLLLCIRFSVDGREWWDSNSGMNYAFTFRKGPPRRQIRVSGPAALGGGFMRLNDDDSAPINLRQRNTSPSREMNKAFGVHSAPSKPTGPKNWIFPKLAAQNFEDAPSRSESPTPRMPAVAYKVPPPPDVHTHLTLSKYCAPTSPHSPPKEAQEKLASPNVSPAGPLPDPVKPEMNVMGGQYATLSPPAALVNHNRRSSWNGEKGSWDSFSKVMEQMDDDSSTVQASTDGESTPVAEDSANVTPKEIGSSNDSSPEPAKPLVLKRSTGDLRALLDSDDSGLPTPPSSDLSSPPSPELPSLQSNEALPMSPASSASTGESSPINTVSDNDSITDLANMDVHVDPRGRSTNRDYKMLNNGSYQDFLDKFCFFTSPRMTPSDDPVFSRPTYIPLSGSVSPNGFPFYTNSSNSPRGTPTPTQVYDSANDAFSFSSPTPVQNGGPPTPRASPPVRSPQNGYVTGSTSWSATKLESPSPGLAA